MPFRDKGDSREVGVKLLPSVFGGAAAKASTFPIESLLFIIGLGLLAVDGENTDGHLDGHASNPHCELSMAPRDADVVASCRL